MRIFLISLFSFCLFFSCTKKDNIVSKTISTKEEAIEIYKEALEAMDEGQYLVASKKFDQSERMLPQTDWAAKSSLMSSYCMYALNFYDEAVVNLQRFIKVYPADPNIDYAHYLIAISYYEQILDEKKDIQPLILSRNTMEDFLIKYPDTDYAIDLKFKLDLILNQMAAKEISIARYYIKNEKWIPAIKRLKIIVKKYDDTIFVEEALFRLVEIYHRIGLDGEAKAAAALLGYNYNSSKWYERSYKILNADYEPLKIEKDNNETSLVKRTLKKILKMND
jgi:outer membrane protein assembly factor BamD|tara:strand:+ start:147 stop:983 length:837 start_codon:yes stop_codon:yes gene_type:complete